MAPVDARRADEAQVIDCSTAIARLGGLDILVNCAGI